MQLLFPRSCCRKSEHMCAGMGSVGRWDPGGQRAASSSSGGTATTSAGFPRPPAPSCPLRVPICWHTPCSPEAWAGIAGAPSLALWSNSEQEKHDLRGGISCLLHRLALYIDFNAMLKKKNFRQPPFSDLFFKNYIREKKSKIFRKSHCKIWSLSLLQ